MRDANTTALGRVRTGDPGQVLCPQRLLSCRRWMYKQLRGPAVNTIKQVFWRLPAGPWHRYHAEGKVCCSTDQGFCLCTSVYSYSLFSWKLISLNMYYIDKCLHSIAKCTEIHVIKKKRGITLIIVGFVSKNTFQVGGLMSFSTVMSPSAPVQKRKSVLASFRR